MKTCTSEKPDLSFPPSPHRSAVSMSDRNFSSGNLYYARWFECDCESETDLKFELRSKSTDRSKPFLAIQCNLDLHFRTILCWRRILYIDLNYVRGKCGFWKKASRLRRRQSFPQWRTVGLGNGQTKRLEHFFGNVGPIKYKIGDCIKKNWRSRVCMVYVVRTQDQLCK